MHVYVVICMVHVSVQGGTVVIVANIVTIITGASMSAVSTNGHVEAGEYRLRMFFFFSRSASFARIRVDTAQLKQTSSHLC